MKQRRACRQMPWYTPAVDWHTFAPAMSAALTICVTLLALAARIGQLVAEARRDVAALKEDVTELKQGLRSLQPKLDAVVQLQTLNDAFAQRFTELSDRVLRLEHAARGR